MPLVRFDMIKNVRTPEEIGQILSITQKTIINNFNVPIRDCYQIVTQHERYEMVIQDTGLGIERSDKVLVLSLTSRKRKKEDILKFYKQLADNLSKASLVKPNDLVINMTFNGDDGWSFGLG